MTSLVLVERLASSELGESPSDDPPIAPRRFSLQFVVVDLNVDGHPASGTE